MQYKILIVDDDENICELLRLYLEKDGFDTVVANDGEQAVDYAAKYSPADTEITVNVFKNGEKVVTEIADCGNGIPEKDKPRIFDMFYTSGEAKIADSRRSMGLGLAVCKSIIAAHGGEISVADNRPKGTIFSFTVPSGEVEVHE